jgi:holo-[acyl-carrier protein] synthase
MNAIFGIGTDIVRVQRMAANLQRFGERFARRILTDNELLDFAKSSKPAHFLAKRFAAKEAAAKALGLGISQGLSLRHIGVAHDRHGKPLLEYSGQAAVFCQEQAVSASHISLADEQDYAIAFVTIVAANTA